MPKRPCRVRVGTCGACQNRDKCLLSWIEGGLGAWDDSYRAKRGECAYKTVMGALQLGGGDLAIA